MQTLSRIAITALWISTSALILRAQVPLSEQVVVTAHATPVPFKSLARTARVISREQIENLPIQSVADLVRYAASVEVLARGPYGTQSDFSIRGSTFEQVLIMVDGVRLNNPQTGHHNGDIPVALHDVDRVEVLYGPGSSLHGADAMAGAINIVTRENDSRTEVQLSGGQYGLATASGSIHIPTGPLRRISAWGERSSGFTSDRDFRHLGFRVDGGFGETRFQFAHLDKDFGAKGFYGPSPSREWTTHTMASVNSPLLHGEKWDLEARAAYRTHGDHFLWDVNRPGFAENFHRDHSVEGGAVLDWRLADKSRLTLGGNAGGDWIDSSNLGTHRYGRYALSVELEQKLQDRVVLYPGIRYDRYSNFGGAWSPSLSGLVWLSPTWKLRSSIGESFRIPTFTERYYQDPNHRAESDLKPERALGIEAGVDWLPSAQWSAFFTAFSRDERDAIDWVRVSDSERWRTANIRQVQTDGLEIGIRRSFDDASQIELQYTYLDAQLEAEELLTKYVSRFPRHSFSAATLFALPLKIRIGHGLAYKRRLDGSSYWVADLRASHQFSERVRVFGEISNYLGTEYQEIPGVDMPPRWLRLGLEFR